MAAGLAARIDTKRPGLPQRRFARDDAGAVAVEVGLLALPFFSILAAILETSFVFLSGQVLDSAVHDASRLIRTGQAQQASLTPAAFKALVCERLYGLFPDCEGENALFVEIQTIGGFGETNFTPPVIWDCDPTVVSCTEWTREQRYTPGRGSDFVSVQVYYKRSLMIPFGGLGLGNLPDGQRLLGAATVFRNEPFT